jgi:hypothetical protein
MYAAGGRPSIAPENLAIRGLILMANEKNEKVADFFRTLVSMADLFNYLKFL